MGAGDARSVRWRESSGDLLLDIKDLQVDFATRMGWVTVDDGVQLQMRRGELRALVGESGSGKTVTALSIMRLVPEPPGRIVRGEIVFDGVDLRTISEKRLRGIRGREIGMIFQEPMTSLNPALTVGFQIAEVVRKHTRCSKSKAWERSIELLGLVGIPLPARRARDYPHSFSGGMRQRVMIAIAISCEPKLLLADEPTTALDVTVQAEILDLLKELQEQLEMAVLLVTHDLGVVAEFCEQVTVMYAGQVIESAPCMELFDTPGHPYTSGLMASMPGAALAGGELNVIPGAVPSPARFPAGCRFHPRCDHRLDGICTSGELTLESLTDGRRTRCARIQKGEDLRLVGAE